MSGWAVSNGTMLCNPSFEAAFMPEETVIAVGEEENLQKLEKILNPYEVSGVRFQERESEVLPTET
jgi:hypothetical protein